MQRQGYLCWHLEDESDFEIQEREEEEGVKKAPPKMRSLNKAQRGRSGTSQSKAQEETWNGLWRRNGV